MSAERTASIQRGRPFQPGESGNPKGRPKGAKNKLTDIFLRTVVEDFAEFGASALAAVRREDPATYLKLVAYLVPRELIVQREREPDFAELTHDELGELLQLERLRRVFLSAIESR